MSWQDELRRLDTALADNAISRREYQRKRDELLAAASGVGSPSPVASPLERVYPVPISDETEEAAATTQRVRLPKLSSAELLASTRQTTAPSPADHQPTTSLPQPEIDQFYRSSRPTRSYPASQNAATRNYESPPRQTPTQQYQAPPQQQNYATSPGDDFYPRDLSSSELLTDKSRPTWLFLSVGVFLVIALIIAGVLWLGSESGNEQAAPPPTTTNPALNPELSTEDKIPALPGTANPNNSTMTVDKAQELSLINPTDAEILKRNGLNQYAWKGSAQGNTGYIVAIAEAADASQAAKARDEMINGMTSAGYIQSSGITGQPALATFTANGVDSATSNVVFQSTVFVVRVTVLQKPLGSQEMLISELNKTTQSIVDAFPVSQ